MSTDFFFLLCFKLMVSVYSKPLVPCYFIFGDSLVDNGNNNARNTVAKANYPPYGIDYPGGPTGRFTNGRNVADFIAELLGFSDHIPPFATARGTNAVLNGVNYGSGGAGILDLTGKRFGDLISLNEQLRHHEMSINTITSILGNTDSAMKHLEQCIYSVGMGSNDYASYALLPRYTPQQFASILIDQFSHQLRQLYSYGARKVILFGLGQLGCVPGAVGGISLCAPTGNYAAELFNAELKSLVDVLNNDLIGAKFIYVDTYGITASDPTSNGFRYPSIPCCTVTGAGTCILQGLTCINRNDFAFFDNFHPTEAAVRIVAQRAFRAQAPSDAYPIDIQKLAQA